MDYPKDYPMFGRRSFLKTFACLPLLALTGLGRFAWGAADAAKNLLAATDPTATTLKFHADAKSVPPAIRKDKSQVCSNCVQYQDKQADKVNGEAVAPCIIFGGKYVPGKGWCSVWAGPKKA